MITPHLFGCLALREHRKNEVIGVRWVTMRTALYLDCYLARQRELASTVAQGAYLNSFIAQCQESIKAIMSEALFSEDEGHRQKLLKQAQAIEAKAQAALAQLEALSAQQDLGDKAHDKEGGRNPERAGANAEGHDQKTDDNNH